MLDADASLLYFRFHYFTLRDITPYYATPLILFHYAAAPCRRHAAIDIIIAYATLR